MYTPDTIPNLRCRDCKHFSIRADREEESPCKRIDHKKVQFFKSPFSSYFCGESHLPCSDFEPRFPERADWRDWTTMDEAWPVFIEAWVPYKTLPKHLAFHVLKDYAIDYLVPFELFYHGGLIKDGILLAEYKRLAVKDKIDLRVQLYKVRIERIGGVVIDTGEELPPRDLE